MGKEMNTNIPSLFEGAYDEETWVMLCPVCGGNNLHQVEYSLFNRTEDAEKGLYVGVADVNGSRPKLTVNDDIAGNPSARRHGADIVFNCEQGCVINLAIWQHKGSTYLSVFEVQSPQEELCSPKPR